MLVMTLEQGIVAGSNGHRILVLNWSPVRFWFGTAPVMIWRTALAVARSSEAES